MTREEIMDVLYDAYKNATDKSMKYTFGFMDAIAVIRNLSDDAFRQTTAKR